jgi:cobalt-zinc-cadmium efflux system membrane fusion protein
VAVAAVVGGLVLVIWLGGRFFGRPEETAPPATSPPGTFRPTQQQLKTFTIEPVAPHTFVSEELTEGKIGVNADRTTPVYSPYSGRVVRVIAGLGDSVKAGASLATVDASEFVQAQSDLDTAAAQVKIARIDEARKKALYDAKGGSLQDWQQSQAALASAEAAIAAVRNRLRILGLSDAAIEALQASHAAGPAAAITAPITGVVVDRQVGPGQFLQAGGGTPVFTIADPATVWLLAYVRETDAGQVRTGQMVEVHVPAYPRRTFTARVTYVAALVDPVTHRIPVRAEIDNADRALKPEMFASFKILTSGEATSPGVPAAAVVYEGDSAHVWVLSADGLLSYRAIQTGRTNDGLVEVLQGLKVGENVVIRGGLFIDQAATPAAS